jgi:MFS family permease
MDTSDVQTPVPSSVPPTRYRMTALVLAFASTVFAGLVSTLMAAYLPDSVRDLVGSSAVVDVSRVGSYVGALFLVGWALGGVLLGWAGDRFGRVRSFTAAILLYAIFTLAAAWSPTWYVLVACRFLAGIGVGATLVLSAVVVAEAWGQRTRAVALGIVAVGFPIGIVSSGLVTYAVAAWRTGFLVGLIPLLLAVLCGLMLKESEQWRHLQSTHPSKALGHEVRQLLAPANRVDFFVGATIFGAMLVGLWATFSWLPTWAHSLIGTGAEGQQEGGLAVMLLGLGGITGSVVSGFIANALGRKRALLIAFAGCFIASFLLFKTNDVFTPLIYGETAFLALFFGISQGILTAYVPELFPTAVRSTATGVCFNAGRLVTAGAVFFIGVLVPILGGYGNAVFAFSLTYVLGFVATLFGKETKGKVL